MLNLGITQKGIIVVLLVVGGFLLTNGALKISLSGADILNDSIVVLKVFSEFFDGQDVAYTTKASSNISEIRKINATYSHPIDHKSGISGAIDIEITLRTQEAWAADNEIRYSVTAEVKNTTRVHDIFFVIIDTEHDLQADFNKTTDVLEIKKERRDLEHLIQLRQVDSSNIWLKNGNFTLPKKMDLSVYGIYSIDYVGRLIPKTETLVNVDIASVKVQADASRALINQVNESKKTNHIIEGLTWILISVIPIGFGFEIIIRKYYN